MSEHSVFEMRDRLLPFGIFRWTVGKKGVENLYQLRRIGQVRIAYLLTVLPQDGTSWGLEQDVVAGVAFLKLAYHFGRQIVVDILCLPIAVNQPEPVNQRTIKDNPLVFNPPSPPYQGGYRVFGDECPIKLSSARFEQELERRADAGLMRDTELRVSVECGVVVSDGFVCGFEDEGWHCILGLTRCLLKSP